MDINNNEFSVAVAGLGYVGCVTAASFAELGWRVTGIDKDAHKVQAVTEGKAPFYEPGLDAMVAKHVKNGTLRATTSAVEGLAEADIVFVCVGTPSEKNGNLGLDQMRRVCAEIGAAIEKRETPFVVVIRSTVFPGTCEQLLRECLPGGGNVSIVANPEFLREGCAVNDFLEPSLIVVGGSEAWAVDKVASLYARLGVAPCKVSLRTAEMIKYACNAFHAVKVSFANEIGALCNQLGIPGQEVMDTFCQDTRLNISRAYLRPGFAFGGSCLPKDLRALNYRAQQMSVKLPLLESVIPSNNEHLGRAVEAVLDLPPCRIGVFGLAFKENTDDLRESAVVLLLEQLIGKGRQVRVFDPHIQLDQIFGANKNYILNAIPHIGNTMENSLEELLGWAEHLVILQKPKPEMRELLRNSKLPLLDLAGAL